jgi:diguanylate cyclase (GGDEF)-like protein/PAS domain S-box-containing protein
MIDSCLEELEKAQYTVSADFVLDVAQLADRICSQPYDVVVAEYPCPSWKRSRASQFLRQAEREIPLLFVTSNPRIESVAELAAGGACDFVDHEHLAQLPAAIRRIVCEVTLRRELEQVRKALRHSQSLYRALVDNPAYGIYRSNARGEVLDVNQALVNMLGYPSREELLAANHAMELLSHLPAGSPLVRRSPTKERIDPVETEWTRKDGTSLKVRISGRGIFDDEGNFAGHEIIAVDSTERQTVEDQLRHAAATDSLTGLANHRRLFEVLHAEICRSGRTGREFSLVLLDLDGLKRINDQLGHLAGDLALCRLGEILKDCCRSIDTAARHGGDEFALVLPETGADAAALMAERICELLASEIEEPTLSASAGIASYPHDADTIGALFYAADRAMYAMKDKRPIAARARA